MPPFYLSTGNTCVVVDAADEAEARVKGEREFKRLALARIPPPIKVVRFAKPDEEIHRLPPLVEYVAEDALALGNEAVVLVHGCNNIGAWGGGFTGAITARYPAVPRSYHLWHSNPAQGLPAFRLGEVLFTGLDGKPVVDPYYPQQVIANAITQRGIGVVPGQPIPLRLNALRKCLRTVAKNARHRDAYIRMPRIGCGLAGGTWDVVGPIVEDVAARYAVRIVVCDIPARTAPPTQESTLF